MRQLGVCSILKRCRRKLWDAVTGQHDKDDQAKKVQEHLNKTGIPDADKVNIQIADGKATVTGDRLSQEAKEKILKVVGNISGIASVDDQVKRRHQPLPASFIPLSLPTPECHFQTGLR